MLLALLSTRHHSETVQTSTVCRGSPKCGVKCSPLTSSVFVSPDCPTQWSWWHLVSPSCSTKQLHLHGHWKGQEQFCLCVRISVLGLLGHEQALKSPILFCWGRFSVILTLVIWIKCGAGQMEGVTSHCDILTHMSVTRNTGFFWLCHRRGVRAVQTGSYSMAPWTLETF